MDPRTVGWWALQLVLWIAVPVVTLGVLGLLIPPARLWLLVPAGILTVLGPLAAVALPRLWFRRRRRRPSRRTPRRPGDAGCAGHSAPCS